MKQIILDRINRNIIVITFALSLIFVTFGCSSEQEIRRVEVIGGKTSESKAVNAQEDNALLLKELTTGVVVTFRITDDEIVLEQVTVVSVPKVKPRDVSPGLISIVGMKGDVVVVKTAVPDKEWIIQENKGLVRNPVRVITVALPIETPIDRLIVQLKPEFRPKQFDMRPAFEEFCKKNPKSPLCRDR